MSKLMQPPTISPNLVKWFRWYCRRYARKKFHRVRLSRTSQPLPEMNGEPVVFALNHPSWWDVIFGFVLSGQFPRYRHYAPIEAAMLEKYRIFRKLGLFGLDKGPRGAAQFLRTTERIFQDPFGALWITPQGQFVDVRVRPVQLQQGIGALANRLTNGWIVPVALEYPFWDESTPEALIRIGSALPIAEMSALSVAELTAAIERAMESNMDHLALEAQSRDPEMFEDLLRGKAGVGGVYDLWRRAKSWFRGKPANLHHAQPQ